MQRQSLVANTSTFLKYGWTFLFQHEELHLVYKDVGQVIVGLVKD